MSSFSLKVLSRAFFFSLLEGVVVGECDVELSLSVQADEFLV